MDSILVLVGEAGTRFNDYLLTRIEEIALYDRQIRLWGVQAQEKYISFP